MTNATRIMDCPSSNLCRFFLHQQEQEHSGDVCRCGDVEGRSKTEVVHHIADDQSPDWSRDKADEIVDRERGIGQLNGGEVANHRLCERSARLNNRAVEYQVQVKEQAQVGMLCQPD